MNAFDAYAAQYDAALQQGIAVSGENREFFARGRVEWLARQLMKTGADRPGRVIDFGCGTGDTTPLLREILQPASILGLDTSARSLEFARERFPDCQFAQLEGYRPARDADLVYCNGVFHHIPPAEQPGVLNLIHQMLRPGGLFALWENNPWNPGARLVMRRIPFDRDAIMLWPHATRRLLRAAGFDIISTTSHFFFPKSLRLLRPLELPLSWTSLGAQYQVVARKTD
jgi:SAM-dependent methyltransferase